MLFGRLPIDNGKFPWRLFESSMSRVSLVQFEREERKLQSPDSSIFPPTSRTSKFGNDPNDGTKLVSILKAIYIFSRCDALRRESGIVP
jgi:hypothetical protein